MSAEAYIAFYAAILSTILAVHELRKLRPKLDTAYFFTGERDTADIITLYNGSFRPIVISDFKLLKAQNLKDPNAVEILTGSEAEHIQICIPPQSVYNIKINDQYKFPLPHDTNLYIIVRIMGRRRAIAKLILESS